MHIITIEIRAFLNGSEVVLYPTVIGGNGANYLIDCGYEETFEAFVRGLESEGLSLKDIDVIIISHDDIDHLGAIHRFRKEHPGIRVYCSDIEEQSVSGRVPSERLVQAENSLPQMPPEYREWALGFIAQLKAIQRGPVDGTFIDGEEIIEGVFVIHTPGHTKGHVSFHIPSERTVIASDAIVIENGELNIANPAFTLDMGSAISSLERIRELGPDTLICYHGGVMKELVMERLDALILRYRNQLVFPI